MTGNYFLDRLANADRAAVLDLAREVHLLDGEVLIEQDAAVPVVHFPVSARLSNVTTAPDGAHLETAIVGKEGLSGLAPFMASAPSAWRVVCTVGGRAYLVEAEDLRALSEQRPALRQRLLALTHFYQAQANQLALCNTFHRAPARLARWLLTSSDLTGIDELWVTQEQIANSLGLQRTSIVEAFADLKSTRLIQHSRSRLRLLDKAGLQRRACGCYTQLHHLAVELDILPGNL